MPSITLTTGRAAEAAGSGLVSAGLPGSARAGAAAAMPIAHAAAVAARSNGAALRFDVLMLVLLTRVHLWQRGTLTGGGLPSLRGRAVQAFRAGMRMLVPRRRARRKTDQPSWRDFTGGRSTQVCRSPVMDVTRATRRCGGAGAAPSPRPRLPA